MKSKRTQDGFDSLENRLSIIGCGALGLTAAAYYTSKGYQILLCDSEKRLEKEKRVLMETGIYLEGTLSYEKPVKLCKVTENMEECAGFSKRILVCTSADRHQETAQAIAPFIKSHHMVLIIPGNAGSVLFRKAFEAAGSGAAATAELSESLWSCRKQGAGRVFVASTLQEKRIAAYPSNDTRRVMDGFGGLFEAVPGKHIVETVLNSPNVVSHLAGAVLNAGEIEKKGKEFALFQDGLSEIFISCIEKLEEERNQVLKKNGMEIYHPPSKDLLKALKDYRCHPELDEFRALKGPDSFRHRYVTEDASCGVALLVSLGRRTGVKLPLTEAFLKIVDSVNGENSLIHGRTWENLFGER